MNADQFDEIALLTASSSRRATLRAVTGLVAGGALALFGREDALAIRTKCKKRYSEKEIKRFIRRAAKRYNQSYKKMLCVAKCESNLDPCAHNSAGPWYGLFQFSKWGWKQTPYKKKNAYDPRHNAMAAAWMWKHFDPADHWTCYGRGHCGFN